MAKKTAPSSNKVNPYLLTVVIVLIGAFSYYLFSYLKPQEPSEEIEVSAIPTPTLFPLPAKETTFQVSGGKKTGPKPSSVTFSTIALKPDIDQAISVTLADTADIREVSALITTDNKTRTLKFALKDGTAKNGTWQATWKADDTADSTYKVDFKFVGSEVNSLFGYGFR